MWSDGLTEKQKRFVIAYAETANASESARRAGYSPKTAYRTGCENMQKRQVIKAISEFTAEAREKEIMSAHEVLKLITDIAKGDEKEEIIIIDDKGRRKKTMQTPRIHDRLKATEMMAKRYGLLVDNIQAKVDAKIEIKVDYGDDEE